jgi:spore coat polysaccharide biosynthesis predicted glycosyltransferase SpsG
MNRDPILFRVDGTVRLGWEHLARCQTLAAALQRRRRPTYFLADLEPGSLGLSIKRAGHDWLQAHHPAGSPEDLAEVMQEVQRLRPAAVILDTPNLQEGYLRELTEAGVLVVVLDNLGATRFPCRLVINPLLAPDDEGYEIGRGTQLLLGPRYALVRSEIRRVRPLRSQEPAQPFRGLVALGDDPHHKSADLAKLLLNCPRVGRVDVAVRPCHPTLPALQELAASSPDRLEIVSEPAEVTARVIRCHFAVTAGNTWSLELACVGVPQMSIVQQEAYWPTAQRLEEEGAAMCLGWHENVSAQTIRHAVHNVLSDNLERQAMSRCGRQLIDGRGPDRLVTGLEVLLHSTRPPVLAQAA